MAREGSQVHPTLDTHHQNRPWPPCQNPWCCPGFLHPRTLPFTHQGRTPPSPGMVWVTLLRAFREAEKMRVFQPQLAQSVCWEKEAGRGFCWGGAVATEGGGAGQAPFGALALAQWPLDTASQPPPRSWAWEETAWESPLGWAGGLLCCPRCEWHPWVTHPAGILRLAPGSWEGISVIKGSANYKPGLPAAGRSSLPFAPPSFCVSLQDKGQQPA